MIAWCALRERALLIVGLIVSSTLLVCDAWFDVATSLDTADEAVTLVTALVIELPLAAYFALLAYRYLRTTPRQPPRVRRQALRSVPLARDQRDAPLGDRPTPARPPALCTSANARDARGRRPSSDSAAESCVRMRAWPIGTTG